TRVRDVAKRPESLIGEAEIESLFLFRRKPEASECVARMVGRNGDVVVLVNGVAVGVSGALRDPGAVTCADDWLKRSHQPGRRDFIVDRVTMEKMFVGLAVGNHEESASVESALHVHAQALQCPDGLSGVAQPGLFCGGRTCRVQADGEALDLGGNRSKNTFGR